MYLINPCSTQGQIQCPRGILEPLVILVQHDHVDVLTTFLIVAGTRRRFFRYMIPTAAPHSIAHGILDNETYDWANLCAGMLESDGEGLAVQDPEIIQAWEFVPMWSG